MRISPTATGRGNGELPFTQPPVPGDRVHPVRESPLSQVHHRIPSLAVEQQLITLDPATFFDPMGTAGPKTPPGTPVTVTIAAQDFQGPDWRVEVVRQPDNGG